MSGAGYHRLLPGALSGAPIGDPPVQDWADLKQSHDRLKDQLAALRLDMRTLEAQAFALVWFIPEKVTLGEIQAVRDRMIDTLLRVTDLEQENDQLRRLSSSSAEQVTPL